MHRRHQDCFPFGCTAFAASAKLQNICGRRRHFYALRLALGANSVLATFRPYGLNNRLFLAFFIEKFGLKYLRRQAEYVRSVPKCQLNSGLRLVVSRFWTRVLAKGQSTFSTLHGSFDRTAPRPRSTLAREILRPLGRGASLQVRNSLREMGSAEIENRLF